MGVCGMAAHTYFGQLLTASNFGWGTGYLDLRDRVVIMLVQHAKANQRQNQQRQWDQGQQSGQEYSNPFQESVFQFPGASGQESEGRDNHNQNEHSNDIKN